MFAVPQSPRFSAFCIANLFNIRALHYSGPYHRPSVPVSFALYPLVKHKAMSETETSSSSSLLNGAGGKLTALQMLLMCPADATRQVLPLPPNTKSLHPDIMIEESSLNETISPPDGAYNLLKDFPLSTPLLVQSFLDTDFELMESPIPAATFNRRPNNNNNIGSKSSQHTRPYHNNSNQQFSTTRGGSRPGSGRGRSAHHNNHLGDNSHQSNRENQQGHHYQKKPSQRPEHSNTNNQQQYVNTNICT